MTNLANIMSSVNGATFISMDTTTTPILLGGKKNPMQGRIKKHNKGASIMTFQNKKSNAYSNMVERRLVQEGKNPESFSLSPRKWGIRLAGLPIVEHKCNQYLKARQDVGRAPSCVA